MIALDATDLVLAASLLLISGLVSLSLRLKLERKMAIAAVRTSIQLLLVGHVLLWVFQLKQPLGVGAVLTLMAVAAGHAATRRPSRTYPGVLLASIAALFVSGGITTWFVTQTILKVEPWFSPQYVIPFFGLVLGNALTGISLCLDRLLLSLDQGRDQIETELALGATGWEAIRDPLRDALRQGMTPILNAMVVVGIVSLPGVLTGQILAGADPTLAVKYQILVMFMLAAATALGAIIIGLATYRRLINTKHQLRASEIQKTDR